MGTTLIVQPDPPCAYRVAAVLRRLRRPWRAVYSLQEALVELAAAEFDAIIADISLADSQGIRTFFDLAAAAPSTPLIVTAGRRESHAARVIMSGATFVPRSKLSPDDVREAIGEPDSRAA